MADFKISGKNVITQAGTDEPVLASNVTLGTGIVKPGNISDAATSTLSCTTASSTTVTTADSSSLSLGMAVTGTGIPANAYIVTIPNATSFTIPSAATDSATKTLTFRTGVTSGKLNFEGTIDNTTFLRSDKTWATAGSPSIVDGGNATALTIDSDEALTVNGSFKQLTNRNLSGTYSSHELFIADGYTLTGNITVNEDIALTKLSDDGTTITLTTDGTSRTITGTGSIEASTIAQTPVTSLTGMTGELNSAVTGELNSAITGSPAIHLNNAAGTIPSAVTGGTGLTPTIDFAWASSPLSRSDNYTTYFNYTSQGSSIIPGPDRFTIQIAGYYYAEGWQRVASSGSYQQFFKNNVATYGLGGAALGQHDHARGGTSEYSLSNFMGLCAVGDYLHTMCNNGEYGSVANHGYNGGMYVWRLR